VKLAHFAGDALTDDAGIAIDQDAHWEFGVRNAESAVGQAVPEGNGVSGTA
jgi:hypothetical protein